MKIIIRTSYLFCVAVFLANCAMPPVSDDSSTTASLNSGIELENFDPTVRPQQDFFQFVNGSWLARTEIPADKANYTAFTEVYDRTQQQLRAIVEDLIASPQFDDSEEQKIADFYQSFMDETTINSNGVGAIQSLVDFAGDVKTIDDVMLRFGYLQRYGIASPISLWVDQDAKATDQYIVHLSQGGLGLPDRDYYFDNDFADIRSQYRNYIADMLSLAGVSNADGAALRIYSLERAIADLHWSRTKNRDRDLTYNKHAIHELQQDSRFINWASFTDAADLPIDLEHVIVRQPDYVRYIDTIVGHTDPNTWADYFRFHTINAFAPYLSELFVDTRFAFYGTTLRGIEQNRPRWKRGLTLLDQHIGELLGKQYIAEYFPPHAKQRMDELIINLHSAFEVSIDQLEWMSDETKARAQQKLAKFNAKIGYPDQWRDYAALKIDNDLIANLRRSYDFEYQRNVSKLGRPVDRNEWFMTPQTVNAYYSRNLNEIVFPAAILQPPFFDVTADDAVNYGAIGAVIGHEFSHGFDDQGRKSDGDGYLTDWWTAQDAAQFEARAKKLVVQYHDFEPLPGMNLNGELTLGENIADLAGVTMAYRAYLRSLQGNQAPILNGFSGEQRFFIGWGKAWRGMIREEELKRRLVVAYHSPNRYRVNGTLANIDAFYNAFAIAPTDPMFLSPDRRTYLW